MESAKISKFEAYGNVAKEITNEIVCSGRSLTQEIKIPAIVKDISTKLELNKKDNLLDIGCATGLITSKLLKCVNSVCAVDNENMIERFKELHLDEAKRITFIPGNFLNVDLEVEFDKILCYSVIHYLRNKDEVYAFINRTVSLLKPGGMALFGDLPNVSHKDRFLNTDFGKIFSKTYKEETKCLNFSDAVRFDEIFSNSSSCFANFDDNFLIEIISRYRSRGFSTYILPQNGERNTFGYTREDILIKRYRQI